MRSFRIDISHKPNLVASLIIILLVDADRIDPQYPVFRAVAKVAERRLAILCYPDPSFITSDLVRYLVIAIFRSPGVGDCFILRIVLQSDME